MEEILASIRRIISEDDAPAEEGAAEAAPEAVAEESSYEEYTPDTSADDDAGEDVLELTEPLDAPVESHGDLDVYTPPAAAAPEPELPPVSDTERLVGDHAAAAAASAFTSLSAAITMPKEGRTLEDVVREMLRPMLKVWLDDNLPRIVEAQVAQEVERIARQRAG